MTASASASVKPWDASQTKLLRKWLQKAELFHKDLERILYQYANITDPATQLKDMSSAEWDLVYTKCTVERAQELKDNASKMRWQKQLKKFEKVWRKESGIKSTSITTKQQKKSKSKSSNKNAATSDTAPALLAGAELKKFLVTQNMFDLDLFERLVSQYEVCNESDIGVKISSIEMLDTLLNEVKVERNRNISETKAKLRLQKTLTKFERIWRKQTGIKSTSITKHTLQNNNSNQSKHSEDDDFSNVMGVRNKAIKQYLQQNDIWVQELLEGLIQNGVSHPSMIEFLTEPEFDEIVRVTRVERFKQLKDQSARNRCDKKLVAFEKLWRNATGIKKTSVTKNTYAATTDNED